MTIAGTGAIRELWARVKSWCDARFLRLSGGTMSGPVSTGRAGGAWISGMSQANSCMQWTTPGVRDGSRYDPIVFGKDTAGNVWNFGWLANGRVGLVGFKAGRTANGYDSELSLDPATGAVHSMNFSGPLSGNASSATRLATAHTIRTDLASTAAASFDGTGNVAPGVTGTLPIASGGTGATTAAAALANLGASQALPVGTVLAMASDAAPALTGTWTRLTAWHVPMTGKTLYLYQRTK